MCKCASKKCSWPDGVVVKPDGRQELDPCKYQLKEVHSNVTVEISQCPVCGAVDISWTRQPNTEDKYIGKLI